MRACVSVYVILCVRAYVADVCMFLQPIYDLLPLILFKKTYNVLTFQLNCIISAAVHDIQPW